MVLDLQLIHVVRPVHLNLWDQVVQEDPPHLVYPVDIQFTRSIIIIIIIIIYFSWGGGCEYSQNPNRL